MKARKEGMKMKPKKTSKIVVMLLCAVFIITNLSLTASADTGPKASVRILFENMGDELCYGTSVSYTHLDVYKRQAEHSR